MVTKRTNPLNPGEAMELNAQTYDLSEVAAKAAIYAIIHTLQNRVNINADLFTEIMADATKYTDTLKKK